MTLEDQREAVGSAIFNFVDEKYGQTTNTGKITGMVLASAKDDFVSLNETAISGAIYKKIEESISLFKQQEVAKEKK